MNFEQPLPVLDVSEEALLIETKDSATGSLTVKNLGGSVLKGYVCSRHRALTFEPDWWEGNSAALSYHFNPAHTGISPGQSLQTQVYICSNGGEAALPVTIKLTKMAITTREGQIIANVRDFYDYALAYPMQARQIFTDSEFYMLLMAVGYPYMEVYESLHKDANRERAMDNFFILSGLKEKTTLFLPKQRFVYDQNHGDMGKIYGQIMVEKSDRGFYEAPIAPESAPPWLTLSANRLISSDFDAQNQARVNFCIDPVHISARYARERVRIENCTAELIFRRPLPLTARLNREAFRFEDKGIIEISNHSGGDLAIEVFCPDAYVRFAARTYSVGTYYEVPFGVKLSPFMNAGRLFRRTPFMRTAIEIKGTSPGRVFKLRLPLTVGEW
ncbi:MAG: DUF5717 family protein [Defluviitaleaceae bacterium]|nr:DUF5717 family protein [Defluviitaleaceae bacterium]MCL2240654.1 DUF5717 family protein [Defluviitaleaceae bacterium]